MSIKNWELSNGSNINSVKASFQGQETFANQLQGIEWSVERMQYTLELLETRKSKATVEFYEQHIEKYVHTHRDRLKTLKNLMKKILRMTMVIEEYAQN